MENKKPSFIEYIWIFTIGCLIGYVIETIFYILKYGYYVNKQGLLFGPFKPIYGLGCVIITLLYYLLKKRSNLCIFIYSCIIGTIFEYLASLFIEKVFNSYIWSYKTFRFNINGRIYLPYCLIWGIISLIWIKCIYPYLKKLYLGISKFKFFKYVSVALTIFMFLNVFFTGVVLLRQGYRDKQNRVFNIIDRIYKEEDILKKFPKFRGLK